MALGMSRLPRRLLLAAGGTVLAGVGRRKPGLWVPANAEDTGTPQVEMRTLQDIVPAKPPSPLPAVNFTTLDGGRKTLADYAGRKLLLNFWATWCVPCVAELPELDRLAADGRITVLAISADRGGSAAVSPFITAHHISHATILLDPGSDAVHALQVAGFPTTLLVGADGKLRGTLEGPAAWGGTAAYLQTLLSS